MNDSSEAQGPAPDLEAEAPSAFQLLCGSLAAQVHMALGLIADPVDQKVRVEVGAAKQGIDILAMLADKTKGNLDEREEKTLGLLLAQLRMIFVERVKELSQSGSPEPVEGTDDGPTIITP